eukprot:tig00021276_g19898.t1
MYHGSDLQFFDVSDDCSQVVTANKDRTISVWDFASGEEVHRLTGHHGDIEAVAFLHGATTVVSAGKGELRVWPLNRKQLRPLKPVFNGYHASAHSLYLSPDLRLRYATKTTVGLRDLSTGLCINEAYLQCLHVVDAKRVLSLHGKPEGRKLALTNLDSNGDEWDACHAARDRITQLLAVSANGARAVFVQNEGLVLWDLRLGEPIGYPVMYKGLCDFLNGFKRTVPLMFTFSNATAVFLDDLRVILSLRIKVLSVVHVPSPNGKLLQLLCYSRGGPNTRDRPPQLWIQDAASNEVLKRIDWRISLDTILSLERCHRIKTSPHIPSADPVVDEFGQIHPRYVMLRRCLRSPPLLFSERARSPSSTPLVVLDLESGCEAACLAAQRACPPDAACARLAPGGGRMRVAAAGEGYIWVWDVDLSFLRSNPAGSLPVLNPSRRIAAVKLELFDGCLIDGRTSCSQELRTLAELRSLEGGAAAHAGPAPASLSPRDGR